MRYMYCHYTDKHDFGKYPLVQNSHVSQGQEFWKFLPVEGLLFDNNCQLRNLRELFLSVSGVKLLVSLVQVNPQYATDYQEMIVQSLDNPDVSIQRKVGQAKAVGKNNRLLQQCAIWWAVCVSCLFYITMLFESILYLFVRQGNQTPG